MRINFTNIIFVIIVLITTIILFKYVNPLIAWVFPFFLFIVYKLFNNRKNNNDVFIPIDIDDED
jgi:hypothetical protein